MRKLKYVMARLFFCIAIIAVALNLAAPTAGAEYKFDAAKANNGLLLHLPGIAGTRSIDRNVVRGIELGGFNGVTRIYDWTGPQPGITALLAINHNHDEAKKIAAEITDFHKQWPAAPIYLLSHSGGTGLAAWALEDLPPDVKVAALIMLAPALSPGYDLSLALGHVEGKLYAFSSLADSAVLGAGTKLFGTIDGVKSEAAGKVGFVKPPAADAKQYRKMVLLPYDRTWLKFGNRGDHIGGMNRSFGENVLAPLMLHGQLPASTQPTTAPTAILDEASH